MTGIIYCYIKKDTNKVVYVGQTTNETCRRYKHEKYDPYHENTLEYHYPLSRGIRKNWLDAYEYKVLEEDIEQELLDEREKYYIKYYNTYQDWYNQTMWWWNMPHSILFSEETIALAKEMIKQQKKFNEISKITWISIEHLSSINTWKRYYDSKETYPLNALTQNRKLTVDQVFEIYHLLKHSDLSQEKIGQLYNMTQSAIGLINRWQRYKQDNIEYPIRKKRCDSRL